MFDGAKEVGSKAGMLCLDALETVAFEEFGEEGLGEILGAVASNPLANERFDRQVVLSAKIGEGGLSVGALSLGFEDLGPAGGAEGDRLLWGVAGVVGT